MDTVEILEKFRSCPGSMMAVVEHHGLMSDVLVTRANKFGLVVAGNGLPKSGETILLTVGNLKVEAIVGLQNKAGGSLIFVEPARSAQS